MAANWTLSSLMGLSGLQLIEEMSRNADAVQQNVLAQILAQNAQTEYLKRFSVDGAMDREMFKSTVPMITYDDIQPLIRRIADGDRSPILCAQPISEFLMSSGTTSEPKLIPCNKEVLDRSLLIFSLQTPILNQYMKGLENGKGLNFMFTRPDTKTWGGIVARPATTNIYKSDAFKTLASNNYTSPIEAIYCEDSFQSTYTQMLCGLYQHEQVNRIETLFASGVVRVIKFLQLNWQQMTHDIRTGSLNEKMTHKSIRECMKRVMHPDQDLADLIEHECAKDNWEGIVTRIWPNAKCLCTIVTGTMAQYIPALDYYSGGLPIVSMIYGSSESFFGLNLNPMCKPSDVCYTFMPFLAYFEFLPHGSNDSSDLTHLDLVDLVDVEIGKEYELVVTTIAGLYRYQVGDIVRVTGFYNAAPQVQFVRRKNVLLNIDWEKTTETELLAAVQNASKLLRDFNRSVVDYTSFIDTTTSPDHYVIYWELQANDLTNLTSDNVLEQCCLVMEESFNSIYRLLRDSAKTIGPLEIRVVKNGTFEELTEYALSMGASINQFKLPRCVSSKPMVDLLDSRVVSTHFSPS